MNSYVLPLISNTLMIFLLIIHNQFTLSWRHCFISHRPAAEVIVETLPAGKHQLFLNVVNIKSGFICYNLKYPPKSGSSVQRPSEAHWSQFPISKFNLEQQMIQSN